MKNTLLHCLRLHTTKSKILRLYRTIEYFTGRKETGGNFVEDGTYLQYLCTENGQDIYNLPKVICRNGSWKPFLPTCAGWFFK